MQRRSSCVVVGALLLSSCALTYDPDLVVEREDRYFGHRPLSERSDSAALPDLEEATNLRSCLRYGLQKNPGLRAAFERWRASVERAPQVSTLPDPVFSFAHFVEEVQTRTGPQRNRVGLSQAFPWPGKLRLAGEAAVHRAEALWSKVVATRLALVRRIKRAWFDYAFLARAIGIETANLRLLEQLDPIVQRRIQGGAGQGDLLRLQVEIGKLENDLETLRKLGPTIRARLNAALDRPSDAPMAMPTLREPVTTAVQTEQLATQLERKNPELESLRQEIRRAEKQVDLAALQGLPDFTVGVDWFDTGEALAPGTPGSGDDPVDLRLNMTLPIWRGKYAAARRQAQHSREAAARSLADRQNALRADLELRAYELDDAARQVALYRDTLLPRARQAFEVVRASYRSAGASLLDVIDAQRILLMFEKAYWQASSNWEKSLADLEALCGGEIR